MADRSPANISSQAVVEKMTKDSIPHSVQEGIELALAQLLRSANDIIPREVKCSAREVVFELNGRRDQIGLPCPFKETEAISALQAVEADLVATITNLKDGHEARRISLNVERSACSLFAVYLSAIEGMFKGDPNMRVKLNGLL